MEKILENLLTSEHRKRSLLILEYLERTNRTLQFLAKSLGVTRRTISNDVKDLKEEFSDCIHINTSHLGVEMDVFDYNRFFKRKKKLIQNEDLIKISTAILLGECKSIVEWSSALNYCVKTISRKLKQLGQVTVNYGFSVTSFKVDFVGDESNIRKFFYDLFVQSDYLIIEKLSTYEAEIERMAEEIDSMVGNISKKTIRQIIALAVIRFGKGPLFRESTLKNYFAVDQLAMYVYQELKQLPEISKYSNQEIFEECCFIASIIYLHEKTALLMDSSKELIDYLDASLVVEVVLTEVKDVLKQNILVSEDSLRELINMFLFQQKIKIDLGNVYSKKDYESLEVIQALNKQLFDQLEGRFRNNHQIQTYFLHSRCPSLLASDVLLFLFTNKACQVLRKLVIVLKKNSMIDVVMKEVFADHLGERVLILYQDQLEGLNEPIDTDILVSNVYPFEHDLNPTTRLFFLPEKNDLVEVVVFISKILLTDFVSDDLLGLASTLTPA